MRQNMLKLSTLAILIAGVTNANAAVYKIVEVDETGSGLSAIDSINYYGKNTSGRTETYAQAIQQSKDGEDCFAGTCAADYKTVGESRFGNAGLEYRDEVAFIYDNLQEINDVSTLESYCKNNLGFNTCDTWAESRYFGTGFNTEDNHDGSGYAGLLREQQAFRLGYTRNSFLLVEGQPTPTFAEDSAKYDQSITGALGSIQSNSMNSVPNGIVNDADGGTGTDYVYGVTSGAYFKNGSGYPRPFTKRGFIQDEASFKVALNPPAVDAEATKLAQAMGTTTAWGAIKNPNNTNLLVVGSASFTESYLDDSNRLPSSSDLRINDVKQSLSTSNLNNCSKQANDGDLNGLFGTWECQFTIFANDAYLWNVNPADGSATPIRITARTLDARDPDEKRRSYQASARAIENVNDKLMIVGTSTERVSNDYYVQRAAVYTPKTTLDLNDIKADQWDKKLIGPEFKDGDKRQYAYSVATDINTKDQVTGVAKLYRSESRTYTERMFIYDNTKGSYKFLDAGVNPIFFDGSNGYAAAINNNNVVVGKLDSENANQVDGRQRRQRGFLYNAGTDIAGSPLKAGGAWFLDDLTNDGVTSGNKVANSYRIAEISDINDAGVMSATALYCEGGYDKLTQESTCKGGEKNSERVVAVKLVPIQNGDIQTRPAEETEIKRNGASLGMFALTLLGFIGFRRRK